MNILEIKIKDNNIALVLEKDGRVLDNFKWKEENNLSQKLLEEIDNLLKKNNLSAEDVKLEVDSDMSERFTTHRIAEAIKNAWNF
jgi:tRNA A37 threonylcarbamoyladenosine modification protein TsaB